MCDISLLPDRWNFLYEERLNRSFKGDDKGCACSLRILLLIKSGPDALPLGRERSVDLTSSDVILRDWLLLGGVILLRSTEALCSSKIVYCVKKKII